MGKVTKMATTYIIQPCPPPQPYDVPQLWESHPSWAQGIQALNSYNHWVSEVIMPIAFQWIEEHKAEVYAQVPQELKDDVGVVIAAAFDLIKGLSAYQKGIEMNKEYEKAVKDGTLDSASLNPVWASISKDVREATDESFEIHKDVLKDTIR
jgi:hypothetical protein